MPLKKSNLLQLVVMVVSLVAILVMLGMGLTHVKKEEAAAVSAGNTALETAHFKVVNLMGSMVGDLNTLAKSWELAAYLTDENDAALEVLQDQWLQFSDTRILYDQIRFIDGAGLEKIRVNFTSGGAVIVPANQLQDKSSRYYFKDSIALEDGEIFVSALDLNKENGQVEEPFKPMLRLGLPVFLPDGSKKGIILVNVLAQEILDLVQREVNRPPFDAMVLNAEGFWLLAKNEGDVWSFMFDGAWSFPASHPKVWEEMGQQDRGQVENLSGLYLFDTVRPMAELAETVSGLNLGPGQENFHWILVAHSSRETLSSLRNILILERLPWLVLPVVLLLQAGINFFRRRTLISQGGTDNAR